MIRWSKSGRQLARDDANDDVRSRSMVLVRGDDHRRPSFDALSARKVDNDDISRLCPATYLFSAGLLACSTENAVNSRRSSSDQESLYSIVSLELESPLKIKLARRSCSAG